MSRSVSGRISSTPCSATAAARDGDVAGIVDARREEVPAGGVQRGRERIDVGRDGLGAGTPEGADDVDALTRRT